MGKIDIDRLMTIANYADLEGKTVNTIRNWVRDGIIMGVRVDGVQFVVASNFQIETYKKYK